jgi:hypothetical protein
MSLGSSRRPEARWLGKNVSATARAVVGLFFPQSQALGLDRTCHSPRVQQKVVHAGVHSVSYQQAARDLVELSELNIPPKQVERLTKRIGQERTAERNAAVAAYQRRPLMEKDAAADPSRPCPQVAMVSVDGGRLQIRGSNAVSGDCSSHWRESKVAALETYLSCESPEDPDPHVPRCFLDLGPTIRLVRGLGHALPVGLDGASQGDARRSKARRRSARPGRPQRLVRSVVASRLTASDFGPVVEQAAWERNFFASRRRAFLGDGQAANWTIHREHFSKFEPILDFVHALSYVFAAAMAGRLPAEGFTVYLRWIQAVWSGQVETILPELKTRLAELGVPPAECSESDPRRLVFESLRYLSNNASRMRYDSYRRMGLPVMTSAVESTIKQINRRVKGSEKFWSEPGAEAILQLRADYLSETEPMKRFWNRRQNTADGHRRYRRTA